MLHTTTTTTPAKAGLIKIIEKNRIVNTLLCSVLYFSTVSFTDSALCLSADKPRGDKRTSVLSCLLYLRLFKYSFFARPPLPGISVTLLFLRRASASDTSYRAAHLVGWNLCSSNCKRISASNVYGHIFGNRVRISDALADTATHTHIQHTPAASNNANRRRRRSRLARICACAHYCQRIPRSSSLAQCRSQAS